MKSGIYFFWLLSVVFLMGSKQVHASNSLSKCFGQSTSVKTVSSFDNVVKAEFTSSQSGQTTTNIDFILGIEDDDEEQEFIGKQAPVVKYNKIILSLCALPPPVNTLSKNNISTDLLSFFGSCRYIAHRALLI